MSTLRAKTDIVLRTTSKALSLFSLLVLSFATVAFAQVDLPSEPTPLVLIDNVEDSPYVVSNAVVRSTDKGKVLILNISSTEVGVESPPYVWALQRNDGKVTKLTARRMSTSPSEAGVDRTYILPIDYLDLDGAGVTLTVGAEIGTSGGEASEVPGTSGLENILAEQSTEPCLICTWCEDKAASRCEDSGGVCSFSCNCSDEKCEFKCCDAFAPE